jgi:hypothetical protein
MLKGNGTRLKKAKTAHLNGTFGQASEFFIFNDTIIFILVNLAVSVGVSIHMIFLKQRL